MRQRPTTAAMSTSFSSGLVGLSSQTSRVWSSIASATLSTRVRVDKRETQPGALQHAVEQAERAAVDVVAGDDVVARSSRCSTRVLGGHAAGEGQPEAAAVQRRPGTLSSAARVGLAVRE